MNKSRGNPLRSVNRRGLERRRAGNFNQASHYRNHNTDINVAPRLFGASLCGGKPSIYQ